jgi:hypothetical protein
MFNTIKTTNFIPWRVLVALASLSVPAAAAITYQVTIYPQVLPGYLAPGKGTEDAFTSDEFNAALPPYPPEFSEIQVTFNATPAEMTSGQGEFGASVSMPEANIFGPVPMGDNLVPCDSISSPTCWSAQVLYDSAVPTPGQTYDEMIIELQDGLNQEWQILVYLPPDANAIGDATSVTANYMEPFNSGLSQGITNFCSPYYTCSAVGQAIPEPASHWLALAGIAALAITRATRLQMHPARGKDARRFRRLEADPAVVS